ncbi:MAG: response regulator [Pseudomonadota bacterium]
MDNAKKSVLIVEDEALVRFLIVDEFEEAGFRVSESPTATEAIEVLKTQPEFDLLFTDIRMPGSVDGWELGRRARELHPDITIIYATGYGVDDNQPVGRSFTIQKPYRFTEISQLLEEIGMMR